MEFSLEAAREWLARALAWRPPAELASVAAAVWEQCLAVLDNPLVRTVGLLLIVFFTIRAIAAIYGGDIQNGKLGPLGLRAHSTQALTKQDVRLPRVLMPMSLDGVRATCEVFYVFQDRNGRRVERRLHAIEDAKINVVPTNLPRVVATCYGQEMTDAIRALNSEDVRFPTPDADVADAEQASATPATVGEYVDQNKVIERWTEDDSALIISVHPDVLKRIADEREEFIVDGAKTLRAAKEGSWWAKRRVGRLARRRPGVVGSYYVRFKLSRDPLFILTRHPDRDLKMTAWLTVLTSVFAMIMEAWPLNLSGDAQAKPAPAERAATPHPRPTPPNT